MIGALIGIILVLIIVGIVWWAIMQLLPLLPIGEPFMTIVRVLCIVVLALIIIGYVIIPLLNAAGVHVGGPFH